MVGREKKEGGRRGDGYCGEWEERGGRNRKDEWWK